MRRGSRNASMGALTSADRRRLRAETRELDTLYPCGALLLRLGMLVQDLMGCESRACSYLRRLDGGWGPIGHTWGTPGEEIAQALDLPLATVRTYAHRALRRLGVDDRRKLIVTGERLVH